MLPQFKAAGLAVVFDQHRPHLLSAEPKNPLIPHRLSGDPNKITDNYHFFLKKWFFLTLLIKIYLNLQSLQ